MIRCVGKSVKEIIDEYGYDWSNLYLDQISFEYQDLSNVILPDDTELFQRLVGKSLACTKMPRGNYSKHNFDGVYLIHTAFASDSVFSDDKDVFQRICFKTLGYATLPYGDYSDYNFDGVELGGVVFTPDSIFSKDKMVFQKIENKDLCYVALPEGDYSEYNFEGVDIRHAVFTENSKFSSDIDIFQKIKFRDLTQTRLPKGDYRLYNFHKVDLDGTVFTKETLLPEYEEFLEDIIYKNSFALTDNMLRNIHNYKLDNAIVDLRIGKYAEVINEEQMSILKYKYPNSIGRNIVLPIKYGNESEYIEKFAI